MDDRNNRNGNSDSPQACAFHAREGRRVLWRGGFRALLCPVTFLFFFRFGVRSLFSALSTWLAGETILFSIFGDLLCFGMTVPLYAALYVRAYAYYTGESMRWDNARLSSFSVLLLLLFGAFFASVALLSAGFWVAGLLYRYGSADAAAFCSAMLSAGCGILGTAVIFGLATRYLYAFHAVLIGGMRAGSALSESRRLCRAFPRLCLSLGRRICLCVLLSFLTDGIAGIIGTPYCLFCAVSVFENLPVAQQAAKSVELIIVPRSDQSWQKNSI